MHICIGDSLSEPCLWKTVCGGSVAAEYGGGMVADIMVMVQGGE